MDYDAAALEMHRAHRGKIEIKGKVAVKTRDDLSTARHTPPASPSPAAA